MFGGREEGRTEREANSSLCNSIEPEPHPQLFEEDKHQDCMRSKTNEGRNITLVESERTVGFQNLRSTVSNGLVFTRSCVHHASLHDIEWLSEGGCSCSC